MTEENKDLNKLNEAASQNQTIESSKTNIEADQQLTKKNNDYIFHLKKQLKEQGASSEQVTSLISPIHDQLLEAQSKGITANKLFGSPTQKADYLLHGEPKGKRNSMVNGKERRVQFDLLTNIGNILIFLGLFAIMYGVMGMVMKDGEKGQPGILSLLIIGISAGIFVTYTNYWTDMPRKMRPKFWKVTLMIFGMTLGLIGVVALTYLIPRQINPVLTGPYYVLVGIIAFGIYYILKKKFDLKTTPTPATRNNKKRK